MNAAFFVIRQVWKKYAFPIFDKEQIDLYNATTKTAVSQIQIDLNELKKYTISLDKAMKSLNPDDSTDMIGAFCEEIKAEADTKLAQFLQRLKQLQEEYKSCANFYC